MNIMLITQALDNFMAGPVVQHVKNILAIIPKLVYFLVSVLLSVMDFFQVAFRKIAGLDPIMIDNEIVEGDSIYKIITSALFDNKYPAIRTAFWAIIILGIFMLFVTTLIAILRVEYKPDKDKGNSKTPIIANFFKAIFTFAIVPVVCIFGMFLSNSLVQVIDSVTTSASTSSVETYQYYDMWSAPEGIDNELLKNEKSSYIAYDIFGITIPTSSEPFSGVVFKACAYSSNRFRKFGDDYLKQVKDSGNDLGIFGESSSLTDSAQVANIIDNAFSINAKIKTTNSANHSLSSSAISEDYYQDGLFALNGVTTNLTSFSKYNSEMVWFFYDLWSFNFLVAFIAIVIIAKMYFNFTLGLMARLFNVGALFVFSPIPTSLMPLDGGKALEKWRGAFFTQFVIVIAVVFSLNIVSSILSIFQEIQFFGAHVLDYLVRTLFIIAGLNAVDAFIKTVEKILGGDGYDPGKIGGQIMGHVNSGIGMFKQGASVVKGAAAGTALAVGAVGRTGIRGIRAGVRGLNSLNARANRIRNIRSSEREASNAGRVIDINQNTLQREHENSLNQRRNSEIEQMNSSFEGMSTNQRNIEAGKFLQTAKGAEFVNKNFGGDESLAKNAIVNSGNYSAEIASYMRDKQMLENKYNAEGKGTNSKAFKDELDKLSNMGEEERITKGYLSDIGPSARETQIRNEIEKARQVQQQEQDRANQLRAERKADNDALKAAIKSRASKAASGAWGAVKKGYAKIKDKNIEAMKNGSKALKDLGNTFKPWK